MRVSTLRKPVSAMVSAFAASIVSSNALGQVVNESAKLLASDGTAGDSFGWSVSASGDVLVAGALRDDGTNMDTGSAYVFRRNGASWIQEQKLLPSDSDQLPGSAQFGNSVSCSGEVIVVGAVLDNENGPNSGSAYVFRWNGSSWEEEQKLLPTDGGTDDRFGYSVSVWGDVGVVGAYADDDNGGSGSAYVFRWNGSSWVQEQKLLPTDGTTGNFGISVSVCGGLVVVGRYWDEDPGCPGTNCGSAYVFRYDPSQTVCGQKWCIEQKLTASDAAPVDQFGISVSCSGEVIVVGANLDDDNGDNSGAAYVFRWNGSSWVQEQKLLASDGTGGDEFGYSVSSSGSAVLVGAYDPSAPAIGSAYLFAWNGTSWVEQHKLQGSDTAQGDDFGWSVSVSGTLGAVGAHLDDDNDDDSGSAYVFDFAPGIPVVSDWGLIVMSLLVLTAGTLVYTRRQPTPQTLGG